MRPCDTLTAREKDTIALLMEGLSNREIAARLRISENGVKHILGRVFDKTGTNTRLELALWQAKRL